MKALLMVVVLLAVQFCTAADDADSASQAAELLSEKLAKITLNLPDPIYLPFVPMLAVSGISLSLSELHLKGLSTLDIDLTLPSFKNKLLTIDAVLPALTLDADYSAGGRIATMPFAGKSVMNMLADSLHFNVSYEPARFPFNLCVKKETNVTFAADINKLLICFQDINPGKVTGDIINSFLSNIGDDIAKMVTQFLNGDGNDLLINVLNKLISAIPMQHCGEDDEEPSSHDAHRQALLSEDHDGQDWYPRGQFVDGQDDYKDKVLRFMNGLTDIIDSQLSFKEFEKFLAAFGDKKAH